MIDLTRDRLVPVLDGLEQVLTYRPSPSCAWRLRTKGVRVEVPLPGGGVEVRRVKLATVKFAGRQCTTIAAIRDFIGACNPETGPQNPAGEPPESGIDDRLRAAGLLPETPAS